MDSAAAAFTEGSADFVQVHSAAGAFIEVSADFTQGFAAASDPDSPVASVIAGGGRVGTTGRSAEALL